MVSSLDIIGAVDSKTKEDLVRESMQDVQGFPELDDPGYFIIKTRSALLHSTHIHVFALKRPMEGCVHRDMRL